MVLGAVMRHIHLRAGFRPWGQGSPALSLPDVSRAPLGDSSRLVIHLPATSLPQTICTHGGLAMCLHLIADRLRRQLFGSRGFYLFALECLVLKRGMTDQTPALFPLLYPAYSAWLWPLSLMERGGSWDEPGPLW